MTQRSKISPIIALFFLIVCTAKEKTVTGSTADISSRLNKYATADVNGFLYKKIYNYDIVLLGESKHNENVHWRQVSELLDNWFTKAIEEGKEHQKKLTVVLEQPEYSGKMLQDFIEGNEIYKMDYDFHSILNSTVADLQFYWELKWFYKKIADYNKNNTSKIEFRILCIEKDIPMGVSREKRMEFFENKRDILSAKKIVEDMKQHKDHSYIGVFGSFHIGKKRHPKDNIPKLAHELIKRNVKVYTVNRSTADNHPFKQFHLNLSGDIVVEINKLKGCGLRIDSTIFDSWLIHDGSYANDLLICNIPSRNVLRNQISYAENYPDGFTTPLIWAFQRFSQTSLDKNGNPVKQIREKTDTIEADNLIMSLDYCRNALTSMRIAGLPPKEIKRHYANIVGYDERTEIFFIPPDSTAITYWEKYTKENEKKIQTRLLIGLLLYGDMKERQTAISSLRKLTGMNYGNTKEWVTFYREEDS